MPDSLPDVPEVEPRDPEPVAVAIETARALFRSGERLDALRWLRRAAERAEEAGDDVRSVSLARSAADLSTELQSMASPPPAPPLSSLGPPRTLSSELSPASSVTSSLPTPRRMEDGSVSLGAYDDFSDKTVVDAKAQPVLGEALQLGVHITDLPASEAAPRSVTMPSPSSSIPVVGARRPLTLDDVAAPKPALRQAQRVAVSRDPNTPGAWVVRLLAEGLVAPPGTEEALLVALDPNSRMFR